MTTAAAATGLRGYLVARFGSWFTPGRRRAATAALLGAGVLGGSLIPPV